MTVCLFRKYRVFNIVFREYDGAIHTEEECGSVLCQAGPSESPRRGHLYPHLLRLPRAVRLKLEQDRQYVAVNVLVSYWSGSSRSCGVVESGDQLLDRCADDFVCRCSSLVEADYGRSMLDSG
jgi:hypothetical protein